MPMRAMRSSIFMAAMASARAGIGPAGSAALGWARRGRERSWAGTEAEGGYCTPLAADSVCPRGVCAAFARSSKIAGLVSYATLASQKGAGPLCAVARQLRHINSLSIFSQPFQQRLACFFCSA